MVRFPPGWGRGVVHPQAARPDADRRAFRPGWRGTGATPIPRVPVQRYTERVTVPLTGGQDQAAVPGGGTLTLSVGPQGLGTTWYPASAVVSTSTGPLDTSTAKVYLGAQGIPITLQGQAYSGNGTVALAIPNMQPGQVLIVTWTGAHAGDIAAVNITGTMDALVTG